MSGAIFRIVFDSLDFDVNSKIIHTNSLLIIFREQVFSRLKLEMEILESPDNLILPFLVIL